MVLRLYDSKAALNMEAKLEFEVDVEGSVDMIDCREERDSWWCVDDTKGGLVSRRLIVTCALFHTAFSASALQPRAARQPPKCMPDLWAFHVALRSWRRTGVMNSPCRCIRYKFKTLGVLGHRQKSRVFTFNSRYPGTTSQFTND